MMVGRAEGKHEPKACPRCGGLFECKPGDVANCQCAGVELTRGDIECIGEMFGDCLCVGCLRELKAELAVETE